MTAWAQLLHFYQPPTQTHEILRKATEESYRPVIAVLREHAEARVAVNMNAVLTELLADHGLGDVVTGLTELAERGQIEFVGSGRYHPILPLIPEQERRRAIAENAQVNSRLFGPAYRPRGFFPPEMCYSAEILPSIAGLGHEWLMISGVACTAEWPTNVVQRLPLDGQTMPVLFRDDSRSNRISFRETNPQAFIDDLARVGAGEEAYVITAMDAETYGHHVKGWEREFLAATYEGLKHQRGRHERHTTRVHMVQPSQLVTLFPAGEVIEPHPSSWSTTHDDVVAHNPYPLWHAPGNRLHDLQWEYVGHCEEMLAVAGRYADSDEAKKFATMAGDRFQPALHSCQFWWASARPMWDVTMVHRGLLLLTEVALYASRAIRRGSASGRVKKEALWRLAAANEARRELEALLFLDGAP